MSTLGANNLTISDIIRRSKADGTTAYIGELLQLDHSMVMDAAWKEGDGPNSLSVTTRTSLPTFSTRNPNGSTTPSKSTTGQLLETPEWIEAWSEVDEQVIQYGGDIGSKRASEAIAFKQAAQDTITSRFIYGNGTTTAGQTNGLATRYASTTATNGRNVILGGSLSGQTDNMSIWLAKWGDGLHGWYPKSTSGGLIVKDWGPRVVESSSARLVMYAEQWRWGFGLAVPDWRDAVRIPNIDQSLLSAGTGADLFDKMIQAIHCLSSNSSGRTIFYMNRTTQMMLDIQARNDVQSGGQLTYGDVGGRKVEMFRGIPIHREDQLTESETRVT